MKKVGTIALCSFTFWICWFVEVLDTFGINEIAGCISWTIATTTFVYVFVWIAHET